MIAVVDYGMGNIGSVCNALRYLEAEHIVTANPAVMKKADGLILPGVGSFGDAMNNINSRSLADPIIEFIQSGKPFLGICLGYQLLFDESEESPGYKGLGVLKGIVRRFQPDMGLKVPHMGWNTISADSDLKILGEFNGDYMYFVHSYFVDPDMAEEFCVKTYYGIRFAAAVEFENILACQFHPEKSGDDGLKILKKWRASAI